LEVGKDLGERVLKGKALVGIGSQNLLEVHGVNDGMIRKISKRREGTRQIGCIKILLTGGARGRGAVFEGGELL
jgi:hypothetical protein